MNLLTLPVLLPLLGAILLLLTPGLGYRTLLAATVSLLTLLSSVLIATRSFGGEVLVAQMGGWAAPYGISLVADGLSAIMLLLSSLTGLLTVLFMASSFQHAPLQGLSSGLNRARERFGAQSLLQLLFMGVNMSFLTGDLFNLFVAFEVMLIASYALLLIGNELPQLREGFKYVVVNLVGSAIFVIGAGFAYGLFGTLNMADIAVRLQAHGPDARVSLVALMLALVFAIKSALFPLGFWLPHAYPVPPAAITAFFGAMLTKVGIYALLRSFTLMFPQESGLMLTLFMLAGLTMLFGGLGALNEGRWRHLLAFANVSSIGYLVMGIFTGTEAALAASLYYLVNSVLVMFALFLIAALAELIGGKTYRQGGHLHRYPALAMGFMFAALALAGLPPTSGFIGKFALISTVLAAGGTLRVMVVVAALVTGFLLLYTVMSVWRHFFWGATESLERVVLPRSLRLLTGTAVGLLIVLTLFSGSVYRIAQSVAAQLMTNETYIAQVLLPVSENPALPLEEVHR